MSASLFLSGRYLAIAKSLMGQLRKLMHRRRETGT
jgi:hypothetical protein